MGGSAAEGLEKTEYYDFLEPGIYYFTVTGYEGTGEFVYFQSLWAASSKVNDSSSALCYI